MPEKLTLKQILGGAPRALWGNFLIGGIVLIITVLAGGPQIYIEKGTALAACSALFFVYLLISWWSIFALASNRFSENLIISGPYYFVRHPMYSAIIFILNPALAIHFRSWLMLLAIIPIYFVWRRAIKKEDRNLREKFGLAFNDYRRRTWPFFPNLWQINKVIFCGWFGLVVFLIVFVGLNFPAEYLRWVTWEKSNEIIYDEPPSKKAILPSVGAPSGALPVSQDNPAPGGQNQANPAGLPASANYSAESNAIVINKISVKAPLVFAAGTSQKELNAALNKGVIFYPGSALPGADGEVFLTGHSSTYPWNKTPYGRVFTLLDKLERGDTVSLIYNNRQYDYQITSKEVLMPNQVRVSRTSAPTITLYTCWPIGTSLKRLVLRGELVK